jgi:preprotein translocase subunit YajC
MNGIKLVSLALAAFGASLVRAEGFGAGDMRQGLSPFIPLILIFGIFYFLILRPQQKKVKLHQQFLTELKRGDMVITNSGIIGTIRTLSEKFVTLEVDEGVCMKIVRSQILESANTLKEEPKPKPA